MLKSIRRYFRQCFLTGLITIIPLFATIWILRVLVNWAEDFFLGMIPQQLHPKAFLGYDIPGVGLLATLIIIMLFGVIMRTYLAKRIVLLGELILARIPIARGVYPGIKRLLQLVVGDSSAKSSRVVLAPYPHANSRAYAFVTGALMLPDESGREVEHLRVFVPTTPNPTSGFLLMVPTENTIATDLTMDEASKLIVSGGLV